MAQGLRALAAFPEVVGLIPSTHMATQSSVPPVLGHLTHSSVHRDQAHTHTVNRQTGRHASQNSHTIKANKDTKLKDK